MHLSLEVPGQPTLAMRMQPATGPALGDVVYLHGSTFGAALSIFHRLDGRSWADALNEAGFDVWGLDLAGYGDSERYAPGPEPVGRLEDVLPQLQRAVAVVRAHNGGRRVALLAHSWGATVACAYAGRYPPDLSALLLFAPVTVRGVPAGGGAQTAATAAAAGQRSHYPVSLWMQYRRFIEDVPRGEAQVLSEAHFQQWGAAFLGTDPEAQAAMPPAVSTPTGPQRDVLALWSGQPLYDASRISTPTLLVRGAWDSVCSDADARALLSSLAAPVRESVVIERATHLMHLEAQRGLLYNACNDFLRRSAA